MILKLLEGTFDPDASRVERLYQLAFETAQEMEMAEASSSSSTVSDVSSVASTPSSGEKDKGPIRERLFLGSLEVDHCLMHAKSKVIHMTSESEDRFMCGRKLSSSFVRLEQSHLVDAEAMVCANCSHAHRSRAHME